MAELAPFIGYSSPVLLLGVIIAFVWLNGLMKNLKDLFTDMKADITEIKKHVTYADTCIARHDEINRRLDKLERKAV